LSGGALSLYRRAFARLPPEERERERSREIPYAFSLSALSAFFFETGERLGFLGSEGLPPIVAAVSGGGDSMALLWLFRVFYEGEVVVAHLDHGIRGEESEADARFVAEAARRWGLEAALGREDVPGSLRKGESLEAGARRVRCAFLERAARERGAWGVALGHNREDVAETVLFNLLRGSGVRGAAGMPKRRGIFFRPLLGCSRGFLRGLLKCRGIAWREDRTNAGEDCARNFIRNRVMPLLERVNAGASEHLAAFAGEMRAYREEEEERGDALMASCGTDGGLWSAGRGKARSFDERDRALLVRAAGRRLGLPSLSRERLSRLARLMGAFHDFQFQWGQGITVSGDRDRVMWKKEMVPATPGRA
jgi:tRNA(Ile)-lysidine synthase